MAQRDPRHRHEGGYGAGRSHPHGQAYRHGDDARYGAYGPADDEDSRYAGRRDESSHEGRRTGPDEWAERGYGGRGGGEYEGGRGLRSGHFGSAGSYARGGYGGYGSNAGPHASPGGGSGDWGDDEGLGEGEYSERGYQGRQGGSDAYSRSGRGAYGGRPGGFAGGGGYGGSYGDDPRNWGARDDGGSARRGFASGSRDHSHHDPDYQQWRDEQMRSLDEDYRSWREERYRKFSDEFDAWRKNRPSPSEGGSDEASGSGKKS